MEDNPTEYAHNENAINNRKTTKYAKSVKNAVLFSFLRDFPGLFRAPSKIFFRCKPLSDKPFVGSPEK